MANDLFNANIQGTPEVQTVAIQWAQNLVRSIFALKIKESKDLAAFIRSSESDWTGIEINNRKAMQYAPFATAVRSISETLAQLPRHLYRRTEENKRERVRDHWLNSLLNKKPNSYLTPIDFWETMLRWAVSWGNAYAFKSRRRVTGEIIELLPLAPNRVEVEQLDDWTLVYRVAMKSGEIREYSQEDIFHLRGPSDDGIVGFNPVTEYRELIAQGIAQERHAATVFKNGAFPRGIIEHPKELKESAFQRLRESFRALYGGDNSHTTAILEDGAKYHPAQMTSVDSELLESRKFQRALVLAVLRVPLPVGGDLDRATFSNIKNLARWFVDYALLPWAVRAEQSVMAQLMTPGMSDEFFVKWSLDALLRGDTKERAEIYHLGILDGWMNRNEPRELEDMNPLPGLDRPLVPKNMDIVDESGEIISTEESNEDETETEDGQAERDDGGRQQSLASVLSRSSDGGRRNGHSGAGRTESAVLNGVARRIN